MALPIEFHKMKQRRGTASRWMGTNPILLAGELGFEVDADGNVTGVKSGSFNEDLKWSDLPYLIDTLNNLQLPLITPDMDQRLAKFVYQAAEPYGRATLTDTINGADTVINHYATVSDDHFPGDTIITVDTLPVEFQAGDLILIHQAANWRYHNGTPTDDYPVSEGIGYYEYCRIDSVGAGYVVVDRPIRGTYLSDGVIVGGDESNRTVAQIVRVPEYDTLNLNGSLTCDPWDGAKGGILAFMATEVVGTGDANVTGKGYRGVTAVLNDTEYWTEGYAGFPSQSFPMTAPETYGSLRAYIQSAGPALDSYGGTGNTVGSSVHNSILEPIVPYYPNFTNDVLHARAMFGIGSATADVAIPEQAGGGAIIAAVQDSSGWTGSILTAGNDAAGGGSALLYTDTAFPGIIDVSPEALTYAVYGGQGLTLTEARVGEDFASLVKGPSITQNLAAPGAADELVSTEALMTYLANVGLTNALAGDAQSIDLTVTGAHTLLTTPAGKLTQPRQLVLIIQAGSGPKTAPIMKLRTDAGENILNPVLLDQNEAFTDRVQHFDLNANVLAPGTDIILDVTTGATNDQCLVTALLIANAIDTPSIVEVLGDEFEVDGVPDPQWTVDNTNGTVTVLGGNLVLSPNLGLPSVSCGLASNTAFSLNNFVFSVNFADEPWAGTNPGGGKRTFKASVGSLVSITHEYDEDLGENTVTINFGGGNIITSAPLAVPATAFRAYRIGTILYAQYYANGWSTPEQDTNALALSQITLAAGQENLGTAGYVVNVKGTLLRNG